MEIEQGTVLADSTEVHTISDEELARYNLGKQENIGVWLSPTNTKALCNRLRTLTELVMGIHKGIYWTVGDEWFESFIELQHQWLDFLEKDLESSL